MQDVEFEGKTYTVSFEAMPQGLEERLQGDSLPRYLKLLEAVQVRPKAVYNEVKAFGKAHSSVPEVINLLTFAHIQNHRVVEAENLIKETFEKHPEYLFARINYGDQCIRKRKLGLIPEIFPTFDLQELCPEKDVFHTSEFRGFLIMMAYYFRAKKMKEKALPYLAKAKEIEPNHPSVLYLEKKLLKKSFFLRLFGKQ
ncbi:MAG: hypothetical protein P0S96_05510 [Simkaniaceae bacterium]|nr:hypothetical protein [Candidatus Sacchlamyda saccharinae]